MGPRWLWLAGLVGLLVLTVTSAQATAKEEAATDNEGGGAAEGEEKEGEEGEVSVIGSTRPPLTGNPQIDYKYDPNLPHELIGYDLSDYPFYNKLPPDLLDPKFNFSCEDRHDGFYASVPHKCQVYHNCLFNKRYDFLCANYTVFDQKNFICHYVSEVDCKNSEKHYDRNDNLYETTTTTTVRPVTPQVVYVERRPPPLKGPGRIRPVIPHRPFKRPGKRRRTTTTTPAPDYYDYDYYDQYNYQYYDDYYDYADETTTTTTTTTTQRPRRRRPGGRPGRPGSRPGGGRERLRNRQGPNRRGGGTGRRGSRVQDDEAPREQVPQVESERLQDLPSGSGGRRRRPNRPGPKVGPRRKKPTTTTTTTEAAPDDYYYYDDYDYANEEEVTSTTTTTTTTTPAPSQARRTRPRTRGSTRGRQPPQDQTAEATEAEVSPTASGDRGGSGARVSIRRKPVSQSQTQDEPRAPASDTQTQPEKQRPRVGPRFPTRRPQPSSRSTTTSTTQAPATDDDYYYDY